MQQGFVIRNVYKSYQCIGKCSDQTDQSLLKNSREGYIIRDVLSSYCILFTAECCCWKEQAAHLHQKSYEYQQEMSSRIKTLRRDWHSKRGCKGLYYFKLWFSSSAPFTFELLELACVSWLGNRGSLRGFYSICPSSIRLFRTNACVPAKETATQHWGARLSLLLFLQAFSTWAELQVQLVCVITSGSCSSELSSGWDDRLQRQ